MNSNSPCTSRRPRGTAELGHRKEQSIDPPAYRFSWLPPGTEQRPEKMGFNQKGGTLGLPVPGPYCFLHLPCSEEPACSGVRTRSHRFTGVSNMNVCTTCFGISGKLGHQTSCRVLFSSVPAVENPALPQPLSIRRCHLPRANAPLSLEASGSAQSREHLNYDRLELEFPT